MQEILDGKVGLFDLDTWCGRTSTERSAPTEAKTSRQSSKKSSASSKTKSPICLKLSRGGGQSQDASTTRWEHGALLGAFTMHSFGECPREENASRLSQILEACPHPKYSLSAKACQGILNRAVRRGKELPPELKMALEAQSAPAKAQKLAASEHRKNVRQRFLPWQVEQTKYLLYDARGNGNGETVTTLTGDHQNRVTDYTAITYQKVVGTIDCGIAKGTGNQLANQDMFVANGSVVRRLTPMECERLQGYPDGWTAIGERIDSKGKKHKDADSPRYKALGNSIALPFWAYLARRICAQYERTATMASLFDGIGGFPLCFQRSGAVPVWASEIEEFCVAVTKARFGDK